MTIHIITCILLFNIYGYNIQAIPLVDSGVNVRHLINYDQIQRSPHSLSNTIRPTYHLPSHPSSVSERRDELFTYFSKHHNNQPLITATATNSYQITTVSPLLIDNDDLVTVSYYSTIPQSGDWIAAYSPPDVDITQTSPIKFGLCNATNATYYLTTGMGQLTFNFTNLRSGVRFYYFSNGLSSPVEQNTTTDDLVVNFRDLNQPLRPRIIPTGDQNIYMLLWSSYNSTQPMLQWGTVSGLYNQTVLADTRSVNQSSLCGAPATTVGWRDLGLIHNATFTGIVDFDLNNSIIYYRYGDNASNDFSNETTFYVPPLPGQQPVNRSTRILLMADLGVASTDSSYETKLWHCSYPPAINTSQCITSRVLDREIDAVLHTGDISYANGYLSVWDFYLDMISPWSSRVPYLITVGNHESDWPNTTTLNYDNSKSSGGECGVVTTELLPLPKPATKDTPWWSYEIGLFHFVGMSTEHNYSIGSNQYLWIENDLKQINRNITPWVIFTGHRSMYVDSSYCCANYDDDTCSSCVSGSDVQVMDALQANIEPLLHTYRVNLAYAGHFHSLERLSAVYQNQVVQKARTIIDQYGRTIVYHDNPNATVWMVVGAAGAGPNYVDGNYTWTEKAWDNVFGFATVEAINSTHLFFEMIDSATNVAIDRMLITQDFASWTNVDEGSTNDSSSNNNGLSEMDKIIIIVVVISVIFVLILIVMYYFLVIRKQYGERMTVDTGVDMKNMNPISFASVV